MSKVTKCYRCKIHKSDPEDYTFCYHNGIIENKTCDDCMSRTTSTNRFKCEVCEKRRRGTDFKKEMRFGIVKRVCAPCRNPNRKDVQAKQKVKIEAEAIERVCLMCEKKFVASNKFIRRCDACKNNDSSPNLDMWE